MWIPEAGTVAQKDLEPWGYTLCPRALSHASSQTDEVLPRTPQSCSVTAAGASLPCVVYISWYLMQTLFVQISNTFVLCPLIIKYFSFSVS